MAGKASKLVQDLTQVPNIVGGLGLSIAAAQKAFNMDYLENIERILAMTKMLLSGAGSNNAPLTADEQTRFEAFKTLFQELLVAVAPPRYQYSETTLSVKLDLAQTMDLSATAGLGVGFGGISVNAALTLGYGYDYRAAAECRTVIHAVQADEKMFRALQERVAKLDALQLTLPERSTIDQSIINQLSKTFEKVVGAAPPAITDE